jgi:hypothetical protein
MELSSGVSRGFGSYRFEFQILASWPIWWAMVRTSACPTTADQDVEAAFRSQGESAREAASVMMTTRKCVRHGPTGVAISTTANGIPPWRSATSPDARPGPDRTTPCSTAIVARRTDSLMVALTEMRSNGLHDLLGVRGQECAPGGGGREPVIR